jgi:hypothetical protein
MTGRILDDSAGEGNLEIMSPYVAVRFRTQGVVKPVGAVHAAAALLHPRDMK